MWLLATVGSNPTLSATLILRVLFISVSGEVSEWPKEHAWKACVSQGTVGSNPTLSAIEFVGEFGSPAQDGGRSSNRVRPGTEQP